MIHIECPRCKYPHFKATLEGEEKKSLTLGCMNCHHKITFNKGDSA